MKWKYCDIAGKISKSFTSFQIDSVGNIFQQAGGVKPKACQKCKKEFKSRLKSFPIIESVPFYKCENCKFENAGGNATLNHKIENTEHKIIIINKDRIVKIEKKIIGIVCKITKTKNDIVILCGKCDGS